MALTVPTIDDLLDFLQDNGEVQNDFEDWAEQTLQQATDLFRIATLMQDDPTDPFEQRIKNNGIMDLAYWLVVTSEDKEASYSQFQSERIGSYSYSKAMQNVQAGQPTGVTWFDYAVRYFLNNQQGGGAGWSKSEDVFATTYGEWEEVSYPLSRLPRAPDVAG